jgi:hypothetical protein
MRWGKVLSTIGKVAAAPVVVPVKAAKKGTTRVMDNITNTLIGKLVRHGLGWLGVWLMANGVEESLVQRFFEILIVLVSIVWSMAPTIVAARTKTAIGRRLR